MWEPNEQLLLRATAKYKKMEGTLMVTPKRVAWRQNGSADLNPSFNYKQITGLQQTPEGSSKVLLRISAKPASDQNAPPKDHTFHFVSPKALTEREAIKSQITELLVRQRSATGTPSAPSTPASPAVVQTPNIASSSSRASTPASTSNSPMTGTPSASSPIPGSPQSWRQEEFNTRRQLLASSRELHTLHMELVMKGKTVSEEEFWSSPYVKRIRQKLKKTAVSREGKQKGKSSKMVELMPGQQEGADVKYTLTSQIIHNIFNEFPSVKRAYDLNVPDKLSEQQFWKRFLASEFFHRTRTGARSQMAPYDDIFDRCMQEEDEENSRAPDLRMEDIKRAIDLTATQEDHVDSGNAPDFTMRPGQDAKVLPLIRRFNRHAMRVLETPSKRNDREEDDIIKEIDITDLREEKPAERITLDIQDSRRYFESQSGKNDAIKVTEKDATELLASFKTIFQDWQPDLTKPVMKPRVADKACLTLTKAIKRKVRHDERAMGPDARLPPQLQAKVQNYHSATNEILRHFWASYEPYRADKNLRMMDSLRKQQKEKLNEIRTAANSLDADLDRVLQVSYRLGSHGISKKEDVKR
ncbi:hypothetical protein BCR43DRAFT_38191 [Syncephalastrum racemosum]|uniref:BSD domain-containing protein n=1 Tax=Syncephalastrum racemosum TaxID=13706 RepID=A0A1X2HU92_SYNRA|nr:hypothetical protein BCR43DRAFT_38191 [Syncephalastrum racemosum]